MSLSETEILAVINKFHRELFNSPQMKLLVSVYLASVMDPEPYAIVADLKLENQEPGKQVEKIAARVGANVRHSQQMADFQRFPNGDPWSRPGNSIDRVLLPGEMKAMVRLTGKYERFWMEKISGRFRR